MLRAVGEPRRIERAIKRLHGALKGIPSRGVRLTWRGGELRTTIHWARDDAYWWALEPRPTRDALLLGHAPDAPTKRESITCEINLPRAGADRKVAGIIAAEERGALYLCHSGRMGGSRSGQRKSGFREFLADGVWRKLRCPDGEETGALVIPPLDSPRLTRLLGQFVDAVRRFKAGEPPTARTGLCVEPSIADSANAACARRTRRAADPCGAGGAGRSRFRRPAGPALRLRALPLARRARRLRWTGRRIGVKTASMVMGLTTGLWVSAQVRLCDRAFIPATVVRRGDPDAGTVLLKLNRFEAGVTVYTQASTMSDEPAWSRGTGL